MLEEIGDISRVKEHVQGVKDKKYRLMGFGHRIYKNMDPRAAVMRQTCYEVLRELKLENHKLFELAMELERVALSDPYFIDHKLYPNVDFYSGIVLRALGIPVNMFTVIFAVARTVGLDLAMERNDRRCRSQDRAPAPVVQGRDPARLCAAGKALNEPANFMRQMQDSSLLFGPTRRLSRNCTKTIWPIPAVCRAHGAIFLMRCNSRRAAHTMWPTAPFNGSLRRCQKRV